MYMILIYHDNHDNHDERSRARALTVTLPASPLSVGLGQVPGAGEELTKS